MNETEGKYNFDVQHAYEEGAGKEPEGQEFKLSIH